jgi:crotonobetainyl-CoA:carnitine CoA-transferase CaiB-like acyl-CoA transferase
MQGDPDRPPVPVGYPQAAFHAGVQAAADIAVALNERETSGRGQHLDVSQQTAMVWTLMNATGYPPNTGDDPPMHGAARATRVPLLAGRILPCADGYVVFGMAPAGLGLRHTLHMFELMREGGDNADWPATDLDAWGAEMTALNAEDPDAAQERLWEIAERVDTFILTHNQQELFQGAVAHDFMLAPLNTMADVAADPHLAARDYWVELEGRRYPGAFAKLSQTPLRLERPAPALGADQDLLSQASPARVLGAVPARVSGGANGEERPAAFEGLKVADFAWVGVGPLISKALADHGATVIHVESVTRPDVLRLGPPFKDGEAGINRSQFMANFNSSKRGLALNLATEEGRALARRLIEWADVVVESFTPGTMQKLGLDYATIAKDRPELVMLSTCMRGQTGPDRTYAGFGLQGACLSGLHRLTGWPDRKPAGTWGAYTDFINPRYGVAALSSALWHQKRTGEGQHIDLAQSEAGIHFLEPLLLDYLENGRLPQAAGHDSIRACPHGVFQTEGTERYVAIAVETVEQWRALGRVVPLADFEDAKFDDLTARLAAKSAIEDALRDWCAGQTHEAAVDALAAAGVPVSLVQRPTDLYNDPQLAHRKFFVTLDHCEMGPTPYDGPVTIFSETPAVLRKAGPCLGEETHEILSAVLGVDDATIEAAAEAGALE